MKTYSITDTGILREMNQDYFFASDEPVGNLPNLYIVADGMGGHKAGDYASRYTTQRIVASVSRSSGEEPVTILKEAITTANRLLITEAAEDEAKKGMGTTLVAATIIDGRLYVANVGDSRLYIIGTDGIRQITRDHSLVAEMVRIGEVGAKEAREHPDKNIITLDALPVSGGGLLVFVIAKLVILAVPDGIRQVLLVHPMVGKVVCVLIMLAFYCGIGAIIMLIL